MRVSHLAFQVKISAVSGNLYDLESTLTDSHMNNPTLSYQH